MERACARYEELPTALRVRRGHIEDSLRLHNFREQASAQLAWIQAHISDLETATDGDTWWETQQCQRDHERLATDVRVRGAEVEALLVLGRQLQETGHFASDEIRAKMDEVEARCKLLGELSEARAQRLAQVLDLLLFRQEAADVEKWLQGNMAVVESGELHEEEAELMVRFCAAVTRSGFSSAYLTGSLSTVLLLYNLQKSLILNFQFRK